MFNFIKNGDKKQYTEEPDEMPDEVKFSNLLSPGADYVEMGMTCDIENANEPIFPKHCSFYLTNDMKNNLFHKVYVRNKCLTRAELVCIIFDWIIQRNIYTDIRLARSRRNDIICKPVWKYAEYIAVHGIEKTDKKRKNCAVYKIEMSS